MKAKQGAKTRRIGHVIVGLALGLPMFALGQNYVFGPSVRVNDDSPGVSWHQTYSPGQHCIAARGDTVYLVWRDDRGGESHIRFARSNDAGQSFLPDVRVDNTPPGCVGIFPSLAVDDLGIIHVSWLNYNANPLAGAFTHYGRSTDGGLTFLPSVRACDSLAESQYGFPSIAVCRSGRFVCVGRSEAPYPTSHTYRINLGRSTDGGATFVTPDTRVSTDTSLNQYDPTIAVFQDSIVFVAWDDGGGGHVYYARSTDCGTSFRQPSVISDSVVGGVAPSMASDTSGCVYVTWTHGNAGLGITVSRDCGNSFPYPWTVPGSGNGDYPSLCVLGTGQLYLSWDFGTSQSDVAFCYSPDGGATFLPRVYPSDLPGDDNKSTVTANEQGRVFVAWGDGLIGSYYDIYCASGAMSSIEESRAQSPSVMTCEVSPNPSRGPISLTYSLRQGGRTRVEVFDLAGRLIAPLVSNLESPGRYVKTWSGRNSDGKRVSTGIYLIRLTTPEGSACKKVLIMSE